MQDVRWVLQNLEEATTRLKSRNEALSFDTLVELGEARRQAVQAFTEARAEQNRLSREFGMKQKELAPEEREKILAELQRVANEVKTLDAESRRLDGLLDREALETPNLPAPGVPFGKGEDDNVEVRRWREPFTHPFEAIEHDALGQKLGILDFEAASRISGQGFAVYRGLGARLERALQNFFLDRHTRDFGYEEVLAPFIVRRDAMTGTGQLPKFEDDAYQIESDDLFLIPTAEVPLTNLYREMILSADALPKQLCGFSPCFRREAGSAGREVRGLTRVHQFQKVEMVHFCAPEESAETHERLVGHAEALLQDLELPYRVIELCTGDLGFSAQRCYDLEVWLPIQNRWREISSCSNFGDFQARRAGIRFRPGPKEKPRFVHTLNGSGLAIGRTVMAIMEVHQTEDGGIRIPEALQPYMGVSRIG